MIPFSLLWAGFAVFWEYSVVTQGAQWFFTTVVVAYIKLVEERELEVRFGERYRDYRRRPPFVLPRR